MEKKDAKKVAPSASKCCVAETSVGHFMIKMFLALVMIGLALVIAIMVVMSVGKGWKSSCVYKIKEAAQIRMMGEKFDGKLMMHDGSGEMYKITKEAPVAHERIYGNILKVEGNQIIILNNAAMEQIILSEADTVIVSSSTEVGISALEAGQNIIVFGLKNDEEVLVAKMINIQ